MGLVDTVNIGDVVRLNEHWLIDKIDHHSKVISLTAPGMTRTGVARHRTQDRELLKQVSKMGVNLNSGHFVVTHSGHNKVLGHDDKRKSSKIPFQAAHSDERGRINKRITFIFRGTDNFNARSQIEVVAKRPLRLG